MEPVILVVDDDHDTREATSMLLCADGFNVVTADNGREAVELAYLHRPAAILMDLGMYVLNGMDAVKVLRADAQFATTFVAALTGSGDEETRLKSREAGFDSYYIKPVDPRSLTAALKMAVGKAH